MIMWAFFILAPFVLANNMARRREVTQLGVFIVTLFLSWLVPVALLFVKITKPDAPTWS